MKYYVHVKTGEVFAYDSKEQSEIINSLDMNTFSLISRPPKEEDKWDAKSKSFKADLAAVKATALATVSKDYQSLLDANITVPLLKADFQANAASRTKIDACVNRLANGWTPPVGADQWLDAANTPHPITLINMNALANAIATREASLFARLQAAKSAVAAAKTVVAVSSVIL